MLSCYMAMTLNAEYIHKSIDDMYPHSSSGSETLYKNGTTPEPSRGWPIVHLGLKRPVTCPRTGQHVHSAMLRNNTAN